MKNLFGEDVILKSKPKQKEVVMLSAKRDEIHITTFTSGDKRFNVKCPVCDKSNYIIKHGKAFADTETCKHYKEMIVKDSEPDDVVLKDVKFECLRKDMPMQTGSVDYIEIAEIKCPYCNHVEEVESDELGTGTEIWRCQSCYEKFILE